jgi:hypothetical protein
MKRLEERVSEAEEDDDLPPDDQSQKYVIPVTSKLGQIGSELSDEHKSCCDCCSEEGEKYYCLGQGGSTLNGRTETRAAIM